MNDHLIIKLFFERSEQAVAELSKKYGTLCRTLSMRILQNDQDAEECVNDVLHIIFWDEEHQGVYKEDIFPIGPEDDLGRYMVQGRFTTGLETLEGNWRVDFSVENQGEIHWQRPGIPN